MQTNVQNASDSQRSFLLSTVLVAAATVLAAITGSIMLSYYNHNSFHDNIIRSVDAQARTFEYMVNTHLLTSAKVFDALDKAVIETGFRDGNSDEVIQRELLRVQPLAKSNGILSMEVLDDRGGLLAAVGESWRPPTDTVPVTGNDHVWLYWRGIWVLEHHVDILIDGEMVADWVSRIQLPNLERVVKQSNVFIPGSVLAICALGEEDFPCLTIPADGEIPKYYIGENGLCLAPGCTDGAREEEFTKAHGMVATHQGIEGFDVIIVYSVALRDFFVEERKYERFAIFSVLAVAIAGLWVITLRARPITRSLARTTTQMQEILRNLPESVITVSEAGVVHTANAATRWMFGYDSDELVGQDVGRLMPAGIDDDDGRRGRAFPLKAAGSGEDGRRSLHEVVGRRRDGTEFPAELLTSEYAFAGEHHLICIIRDLSQRKRDEESLRRWAHIFENAEWGIAAGSGEGTRIDVMNPAFARMHGYVPAELVGRPLETIFAVEAHGDVERHIEVANARGHHSWEAPHVRRDGSVFIGLMDVTAVRDESGRVLYRIMNLRDVTARKEAEEALRRSEARLANAQRIAHLGDWELDLETGRLKWSDEIWRLLELVPGQCEAATELLLARVDERDRERVRQVLSDARAQPYSIDYRLLRPGDGVRVVHEEAEVVCAADGRPVRMAGTLQDVTEMKQREIKLERQRAQLQELAANHEAVREQERTRIAREIHDELGQSLTILRMNASLLRLGLDGCDPQLARQTDEMKALIDQTIILVRNVATKLRPGALDLGIVSAIDWLAQDFEDRTGIPCSLDIEEGIELEDERATMVFRILQESLTNVARHAEASHVEISFLREGDSYRLEVRDDGRGFSRDDLGQRKTFGLLGIRERATVLQGELAIDSAPNAGTTLRLRIPVECTVNT